MINFYNQVPTIYSNASRDFQYLGWLINIVLNSVKHNVDDLYNLPNTKIDAKLIELLAMTLGFKIRRNYEQKQLLALVSILPVILKNKGTQKAIEILGDALVASSGSIGSFSCEIDDGCLKVYLPEDLVDINLFMDVLPYILPAGMTCRVFRITRREDAYELNIVHNDILRACWYDNKEDTELAGLYDSTEKDKPLEFFNFLGDYKNFNLNAGLLSNTLIPILNQNKTIKVEEEKEGEE